MLVLGQQLPAVLTQSLEGSRPICHHPAPRSTRPPGFTQKVNPDLTLGLLPNGTQAVLEVSPSWLAAPGGGGVADNGLPPRVLTTVRACVRACVHCGTTPAADPQDPILLPFYATTRDAYGLCAERCTNPATMARRLARVGIHR